MGEHQAQTKWLKVNVCLGAHMECKSGVRHSRVHSHLLLAHCSFLSEERSFDQNIQRTLFMHWNSTELNKHFGATFHQKFRIILRTVFIMSRKGKRERPFRAHISMNNGSRKRKKKSNANIYIYRLICSCTTLFFALAHCTSSFRPKQISLTLYLLASFPFFICFLVQLLFWNWCDCRAFFISIFIVLFIRL